MIKDVLIKKKFEQKVGKMRNACIENLDSMFQAQETADGKTLRWKLQKG